ncbi:MAG TPA: gamma-glutamyl-gamma-aminobutyrate hydrolase family protein [Saprospiraceae bacterium]|nr:gamma-glutamyl-gamma-aminobutyrate hydrolase family protein [Saprospiraceae bacterium]HNT22345.1 gamma-glutamyl-gamma-aminobutyrate hydrolase family protein [Saprospiraceae bacterium]
MITIGITETDTNFKHYLPWIQGGDPDIAALILSYKSPNLDDLGKCHGIVLSGGVDWHPKFYNNPRTDYPRADHFIEERDEFELAVFKYARQYRLPVLAICRGMQLVNIALGGDLIQDLEESGKKNHRRMNGEDGLHQVKVRPGSLLHDIVHREEGMVNSAHHQALGRLAEELCSSASSEDDLAEAVEYKSKKDQGFLLGVQWHPERLDIRKGSPAFSKNIRDAFVRAVREKQESSHHPKNSLQ